MKFFDLDGPLVRILNRIADLMWLNILTLICCIPLITVGASFTALHYMALKIVRGEEGYITRGFFKSFRENFRQSTIIWLILMAMITVLIGDYSLIVKQGMELNNIHRMLILVIGVFTLFTGVMIFPVQAKFSNPIRVTIKNSFIVAVLQFPKTFLMMVMLTFPVVLVYISWRLVPFAFLFGFSLPAVLSAALYNKSFQRMEDQFMTANAPEETEEEDEERIFSDKLDESIAEDTSLQ